MSHAAPTEAAQNGATADQNADLMEELRELRQMADENKQEARDRAIREEQANHSTAGAKRSVGFIMKSIHMMDDVDKCWGKLGEEAALEQRGVATPNNLARVNKAIVDQANVFVGLREHFVKELGAQNMASHSVLGWGLVKHVETVPQYNKSAIGLGLEDVRKAEKDLISYRSESRIQICLFV